MGQFVFGLSILNKKVTKHINVTISSLKQIKITSGIDGHHYNKNFLKKLYSILKACIEVFIFFYDIDCNR